VHRPAVPHRPVLTLCAALCGIVLALPPAATARAAGPVLIAEPTVAIGRANHAGYARRRHCTMFAVAPRVAVTATHCIAGLDPTRMHLLFGYAGMAWKHHTSPASARDLGRDVAVLCLSEDAPATLTVAPGTLARGAGVSVVGYGRPRRHAQSATACTVSAVMEGEILLDCPQSEGASGGPVLDGTGAVVAVMSRSGRGSSVAGLIRPRIADACP